MKSVESQGNGKDVWSSQAASSVPVIEKEQRHNKEKVDLVVVSKERNIKEISLKNICQEENTQQWVTEGQVRISFNLDFFKARTGAANCIQQTSGMSGQNYCVIKTLHKACLFIGLNKK